MTDKEKLILKLLYFLCEDYWEDWATPIYKKTVEEACEQVGIPYDKNGRAIQKSISEKGFSLGGDPPTVVENWRDLDVQRDI